VELRIIADDNTEDTASKTITVTIPAAERPSDAPTASFTVNPNRVVAPLEVEFDPANSSAASGKRLDAASWWFGDGTSGESQYDPVDEEFDPITHNFVTEQEEEEFVVVLLVRDNEQSTDTESRSVIVENYQPAAGFMIYDELQPNTYDPSVDPVGGDWVADEVEFVVVQTDSQTVAIQSKNLRKIPAWIGDPAAATIEPIHDANYEDPDYRKFCYDREGQAWDPDDDSVVPADWPVAHPAWGLQEIDVRWDDGATSSYDYYTELPDNGVMSHTYNVLPGQTRTFTITVTATDFLGATDSYSRDVTIRFPND